MDELSLKKRNFIEYIDSIVKNNKVSHAYLIELDNYDDDYKLVLDFIKMIITGIEYNDLNKSNNKIFKLIDDGNYPDINVISTDISVIKKSVMIDLKKEFSNTSLYNQKRFYIIKESEKLNASSANTILKFLEEPEDNIIAFLLTDNIYHVIDTIISRCQIISLKENNSFYNFNDNFLLFFETVLYPKNYFLRYNDFILNISDKDILKKYLEDFEKLIMDYLNSVNNNLLDDYRLLLEKKENKYLVNIISIIEEEIPKLSFNVNYKLWLDSFFSKLIGG